MRRPLSSNWFLDATVVWSIFSFKIVLGGVGDGGVRLDDLLILVSLVILAGRGSLNRVKISKPLRAYLVFICVSLVSVCWNAWVGRVHFWYSLIFVVRLLEYIAFYYLGDYLAKTRFNLRRVMTAYLWTMAFVVPLQLVHIIPLPNAFGGTRASGNTNGPYEFSVVAAFALCYLAYTRKRWAPGLTSFAFVLLSQSRITSIAVVLSVFRFFTFNAKSKKNIYIGSILAIIVCCGLYLGSEFGVANVGLFDRITNSKSVTSWQQCVAMYDAAPVARDEDDYAQGAFAESMKFTAFEGDASGFIRFSRWIILIKSAMSSPDSILLGLGPSFGTLAVDGYFVRVFVETGVLGFVAFMVFAVDLAKEVSGSSMEFRQYVMIMLMTALFIDIFSSYKPMILLWLWHGINQYHAHYKARELKVSSISNLVDANI